MTKQYYFLEKENCDICGKPTISNKILGQRLNKSQGLNPKIKTGITVSVIKCHHCKVIYSNPQPIPFDIQNHYGTPPEDYWKAEYFIYNNQYFVKQLQIVNTLLHNNEKRKALDIGAGLGKAMISMENLGFDAFGFEPSEPFYNKALQEMKINPTKLFLGKIEDIEFEEESFDFVNFGAVFEHLYNPKDCLQKALKWTKKNGIIHIEVPSSRWFIPKLINLFYKLRGTNYVTHLSPMHSPFHLFEYDVKCFEELAISLNFKIEKVEYEICEIYFIPKFLKPFFRYYMKKTNTGMQLIVYLRKL